MAMNKRKTAVAAVAGITAVALLLGGTFAWTSISQMAKNESAGIVNVGGRLHDDFNGKNKDVYVENFTDAYNGGQPIYARVRLDEYMEVGSGAGKLDENGNYDADRKAASVVAGATIDNVDSWSTHKPIENCAECYENGTLCVFHFHWRWEMGGYTTFMPTFNKDKDSLEADVNGTYHGINSADKIYYDDYMEYTTDANNTDKVYFENGTAYYDNDPDKEKNDVEGQYITKNETHYAKDTVNATVITMQQWKERGSQPGNYWVYDSDGWVYWANPIMPGEATGLLLSGIEMFQNPGEKCYYAINVVGQFATVGDWEQFGVDENDEDYPSADAVNLLTTASQNVPAVQISGESYVTVGGIYSYTATASRGALNTAAEGGFAWSVVYENGDPVDASAFTVTETAVGAEITIGNTIPDGTTLLITARSTDEAYLGATGVKAIAVKNPSALIPEVDVTLNDSELANISEITLTADVMYNLAAYEDAPIVWSIEDTSGNTVPETVATLEGDKLTIVQTEGLVELVVKAICTISDNTATETKTVTFNASEFCDTCGTKYTDNGFCPNDTCTDGQYEPAPLSGDTYQIANGGQLFWLAEQVNESGASHNATLTEDIDLEGKEWTPIGLNNELSYSGTFDGAGHSITGLSITASGSNNGLFGRVNTATIRDFSVSGDMIITGVTSKSMGYATIASVFGEATISGIHSALNITVTEDNITDTDNPLSYIGGILGYLNNYATSVTIENCSYTGTIKGAAGISYDCIGGIVAYIYREHTAKINNCLFAGDIKVVTDTSTGGILGYYNGGKMTVTNCLSYGTLSSESTETVVLAAIAGVLKNSTNCTVGNNYYCLKEGSNADLDAYAGNTDSDRAENSAESAPVTETEITDGTVCEKLNGESGTVWTQNGTAYPVPNALTNG